MTLTSIPRFFPTIKEIDQLNDKNTNLKENLFHCFSNFFYLFCNWILTFVFALCVVIVCLWPIYLNCGCNPIQLHHAFGKNLVVPVSMILVIPFLCPDIVIVHSIVAEYLLFLCTSVFNSM